MVLSTKTRGSCSEAPNAIEAIGDHQSSSTTDRKYEHHKNKPITVAGGEKVVRERLSSCLTPNRGGSSGRHISRCQASGYEETTRWVNGEKAQAVT